jgi:hypothetical protein
MKFLPDAVEKKLFGRRQFLKGAGVGMTAVLNTNGLLDVCDQVLQASQTNQIGTATIEDKTFPLYDNTAGSGKLPVRDGLNYARLSPGEEILYAERMFPSGQAVSSLMPGDIVELNLFD